LAGLAEFEGEVHRFQEPSFCGALSRRRRQDLWKRMQLTYQDTDMVFDPNEIVGKSVVRGIRRCNTKLGSHAAWQQAAELFRVFGLSSVLLHAPPARLSGGERKRTAIARSLALLGFPNGDGTSKMLLLDEPTVGVDVFHQGVIAAALIEAQRLLDLTIVVFSHDHSFLTRFCDRLIGWPIESRRETPGE
jgi:ABC-type dipeptide/oligopeptide/nickel transport system ATPase subunit